MRFCHELKKLANAFEADQFVAVKNDVLLVLKSMYGETSREYKVVKQTSSPATIIKVLNHIAERSEDLSLHALAANM
ncbi:MAG: hypothetical protein FNP40_00755 [Dehalobacter sp. 4CP]|uniref:hypothetical protein n=1 Tax=Dehalobacter sp. CP TaxID=2594474 RepID=UPI0013CD6D7C|nr:hypothetical protein [Dehalobacter sp. 4CP]